MNKTSTFARSAAALRELDPGRPTTLTEDERHRASEMLERIVATNPNQQPNPTGVEPARRRGLLLVPAALLTVAAIAVPTFLSGGSAFASWTATPTPLSPPTAEAAASTCLTGLDIHDPGADIVIAEQRGGWTYLLLQSPAGEGACLMPSDLVGSGDVEKRNSGFFGFYDVAPAEAPTLAPDDVMETESAAGMVTLAGALPVGATEEWFTWTSGYAGSDVARVTVHPAVGSGVEATVESGRFSAWWPADKARGDNPGAGGAWTYTVTLTDGTTQNVEAQPQQR